MEIPQQGFWKHLQYLIKLPSTVQEVNEAKLLWKTLFNLPTLIGVLDCTPFEINEPTLFGDKYINRNSYIIT